MAFAVVVVTSDEMASEISRGLRLHRHSARAHDAHTTRTFPSAMPSATRVDTAAARMDISSLPREVLSTHVLSSDFLPEPADLGRLRAVSHAMRDAVDATGREIKKLSDEEAAHLGHVSLLKDRHRRGVLKHRCLTCAAAARKGDVEELKALRADEWPWDTRTCLFAARGGQLETLKWARANGCPWDEWTCAFAARGGHLEVLKWARENGCPWDRITRRLAASKGYVETRTPCVPWVFGWAR